MMHLLSTGWRRAALASGEPEPAQPNDRPGGGVARRAPLARPWGTQGEAACGDALAVYPAHAALGGLAW